MIGVLGRLIVDFPRAERPFHLHRGVSVLVDRVRDRYHAAERRLFYFGHIVLHDQRIANSFHIDGHGFAVLSGGSAGGDMRMRATLILSVGKRQEPVGNVHPLKRDVHDGANSGIGKPSVTGHGVLLSGYEVPCSSRVKNLPVVINLLLLHLLVCLRCEARHNALNLLRFSNYLENPAQSHSPGLPGPVLLP